MVKISNKLCCILFLFGIFTQLSATFILPVQSQDDEVVEVNLTVWIFDVDPKKNLASINIEMDVLSYQSNLPQISVLLYGGGSVFIQCKNSNFLRNDYWLYSGQSNQTDWYLTGEGNCYPFDSYELEFQIANVSSLQDNYEFTGVSAIFYGANSHSLKNIWKTESYSNVPISKSNSKEVTLKLEKTVDKTIIDFLYSLGPIIACYFVLGSSLIFNPKCDLNGRLRIYLSLFVFSSGFLYTIKDSLPVHYSLTFSEFLLVNLIVSTAIFTICTIIGYKIDLQNSLEKSFFHSKADTLGLTISLIIFLIIQVISLHGKMNLATNTILTYVIIPSYLYGLSLNSPSLFKKNKLLIIVSGLLLCIPLFLIVCISIFETFF